ncbi:hypothetical protein SLE2022_361730 [Rubroshorea leprosula]
MAFTLSKAHEPSFLETKEKAMNVMKQGSEEGGDVQTLSPITSHLCLKSSASSSPEALDKEAVLRRIRHHKSLNKVRTALHAMAGGSGKTNWEQKWLELTDAFSCP